MVALAAAYAVALQALLPAIGGPVAGTTDFAALPICSSLGAGQGTPVGHGHDCLSVCLAGCGTAAAPTPAPGIAYLPAPGPSLAVTFEAVRTLPFSATGANRSRAPPSI